MRSANKTIITKLEKEKKIEKVTWNYFDKLKERGKEYAESIGKSHKTIPVKKIGSVRAKHNRTKSDIQLKSTSLLERFLTHVKRKNSAKNSFKEEEQLGTCFEIIEEEKEERQFAGGEEFQNSKKLTKEGSERQKELKPSIEADFERKDNFQTTHKTDIDYNLHTSTITVTDSGDDIVRIHSDVFQKVNRHEWKVLAPQRDVRLGLLQNTFNKISLVKAFHGHLDAVRKVDFLDPSTLFSAGEDGIVQEWRLQRANESTCLEPVNKYRNHTAPIFSTAIDTHHYFSGDANGKLVVLDNGKDNWNFNRVFNTGNEPIWSLDYCQRDNMVISTTPNKVKFWSVDQLSDKKAQSILCSTSHFYTEAKWLEPNHCVIQTCDPSYANGAFLLYDVHKETEYLKISQDSTFSNSFKILKDENLIISANDNHTVSMFDIRDYKPVRSFIAHSSVITALDVQQDSHILITGDQEGSMRVWDLQTLRCVKELSVHRKKFSDSIMDIKIHGESQLVVTAGADSAIRLFSLN